MASSEDGDASATTQKVALSAENLFVEQEEAYELVAIITASTSTSPVDRKDAALTRLRRILDKYLECPTLLDQNVGNISTVLMEAAKHVIIRSDGDANRIEFQHCSHSLSALYALSKVRGRKNVQKFLSHEVEDVEPLICALQQFVNDGKDHDVLAIPINNNPDHPQRWESLYMLWNWLGTLSLVPFDCKIVLGDASMIASLIKLGKDHLAATGPTREASATSLASWLSRPDLETVELAKFVEWSSDIIKKYTHGSFQSPTVFLVLGVMQTLVTVLKVSSSPREIILRLMSPLWEPFILLAESNACDSNQLLRKYMIKWWSRMGCLYMPPRVASWRYQRGRRSLAENLQQTGTSTSKGTDSSSQGQDGTTQKISSNDAHCDKIMDELIDVPDHVEDAMGFIIEALSDSSTTVRWPAAKGVGRLTERLPAVCADDVLDAVLELFTNPEADQAWHGACLALAELSRRGLLLPNRLSEVIPLVVRAIQYDIRREQSSVGSHVRDAACYTYWSFARAYAPSVLKPFVPRLSESIILTCLFDREVNCRRAASAAFQECVGRQGADNFKHGISILTHADYFSLGNRNEAFTSISLYVARFAEYQRVIINHIYQVKLHHWDETIRVLASKALYELSPLDPQYIIDVVLPFLLRSSLDPNDVIVRHGSILGLAEAIASLGHHAVESILPTHLLKDIAETVPAIEKKRLYRGRGGEMIRGAVCRLISCICISKIPMLSKQQVRLLDSIDACLPHPNEKIQENACDALHDLTCNYFPVGPSGPSDRLQKRVVEKYISIALTNENPASTRGFALALGHIPKKLSAPNSTVLGNVIECLSSISRYDATVGNEKDAETRRNALVALRRVCQTVGLSPNLQKSDNEAEQQIGLTFEQISTVLNAFFLGLDDYNVDRRGDVGSWCRIVAMRGLEGVISMVVEQASVEAISELLPVKTLERFIGGLLKQLSEKLDNTRVEAGNCLQRILTKRDPSVPGIPEIQYLQESFGILLTKAGQEKQHINWADASLTFPFVAKAANMDVYFSYIVAGIIISVGGLTESVAKQSNAAILQIVKQGKGTKRMKTLSQNLLELFKSHSREARVILPLLKTIDTLISHRCLDELILDEINPFRDSLLELITKETKNCSDVHRLFACIDVALGLVRDDADDKVLCFACAKLLHRFPRVRRYAAEHLYVCLLEHPDVVTAEESDFSLEESLLNFPWDDAQTSIQQCRDMAEILAKAVGVRLPVTTENRSTVGASALQRATVPRDDFASYAALVDSS